MYVLIGGESESANVDRRNAEYAMAEKCGTAIAIHSNHVQTFV